jgi:hypothetical protein
VINRAQMSQNYSLKNYLWVLPAFVCCLRNSSFYFVTVENNNNYEGHPLQGIFVARRFSGVYR